jgi:hypothetical protein
MPSAVGIVLSIGTAILAISVSFMAIGLLSDRADRDCVVYVFFLDEQ